jgi:hypothetical protein
MRRSVLGDEMIYCCKALPTSLNMMEELLPIIRTVVITITRNDSQHDGIFGDVLSALVIP